MKRCEDGLRQIPFAPVFSTCHENGLNGRRDMTPQGRRHRGFREIAPPPLSGGRNMHA